MSTASESTIDVPEVIMIENWRAKLASSRADVLPVMLKKALGDLSVVTFDETRYTPCNASFSRRSFSFSARKVP